MTLETLESLSQTIRKSNPDLFFRCQPRRIIPPNNYINPSLQTGLICAYLTIPHLAGSGAGYATAATQLVNHSVPVYFLNDDFLRACLATEPPKEMTLQDIKFPISGFTFVLSWEMQRELFPDLYVPFIQVANCPVGEYDLPTLNKFCYNDKHRLIILTSCFKRDAVKTPIEYSNVLPIDTTIEKALEGHDVILDWKENQIKAMDESKVDKDLRKELEFIYATAGEPGLQKKLEEIKKTRNDLKANIAGLEYLIRAKTSDEIDKKVMSLMTSIVIKVSLALSVRPDLIEKQNLVRPERIKHGKVDKEALWSPIVIGRNYRIVYDRKDNKEPSYHVRMHWRRGHYRYQVHGLNNSQRKLIWIEPILVNAPKESL